MTTQSPDATEQVAAAIGEAERSACGGYPFTGDDPKFNPWLTDKHRMFARAAIAALPSNATTNASLVEPTLASLRTWVAGLPHDIESRPQVLADIDSALLRMGK